MAETEVSHEVTREPGFLVWFLTLNILICYINLPVDHVNSVDRQQGSMAPPTAFSSDQLIDPEMSLDPQFLVPIEESVGSDPTKSTHLSSKYMILHLYCHPQRAILIL